jgi:ATP synthase protein I
MTGNNHEARARMEEAVRLRKSRRDAWEKEGERPLWKMLSMVGALGWLIVMPILAGVFAGRWLDGVFGTGVTFSGALTFVGAVLGFVLAWRRMNQE